MREIYYKYITIILGSLLVWLIGVPYLFSRAVPIVCENITFNSSYEIKIEKPRLYTSIIPNAVIKADSVTVRAKENNDKFELKGLKMKLRLLPLLSGRIHINNIQLLDLNMNTKVENMNIDDKLAIQNVKIEKFVCDGVKINNYKICLYNKSEQTELLGGNIDYRLSPRYLKLNIEGQLKQGNEKSEIKTSLFLPKNKNLKKTEFNVLLSNLNLKNFENYIKAFLPEDTTDIRGIVNVSADKNSLEAKFNNFALIRKDEANSIVFPKNITLNSGLSVTGKSLFIKEANLKSDNINLIVGGVISDYLSKQNPSFNLNVQINKSKIEDFISMLPPFKTEDIDAYKLKKYRFYGDIIGNLNIKGTAPEPSINGDLYINNGVLTKPIPNANGATVKLKFLGKYLNFDVLVPANMSEKVMVKGGVELYNVKYSDMRVWSTNKVDLALAEEKVVPIHEILNFVIGPVPIMDITGIGNIDITIKGNRKNPHVWGALNFHSAFAKFKEMPDLKLTSADAVLTFDDENAVFNLKNGIINNKKVDINGTCNLAGKFDFDVFSNNQNLAELYNAVKTSTLVDELKTMLPDFDSLSGLVNLKLKVYGSIKDIEDIKYNENFFTKGNLELLGNDFELKKVKVHNTKGIVNFNNTDADLDVLSQIGASPLSLKAVVKNNIADAQVSITNLNLSELMTVKDNFQKDYTNIYTDVNLKYKGRTDVIEYDKVDLIAKVVGTAKNNKLKISDGVVTVKNDRLQIQDINGSFLDTLTAFDVNLKVDNISTNPAFNGKIKLQDFDLSLISKFAEFSLVPQNIRELINQIKFERGKININALISNNNVNASTNLGGITFSYIPLNLPIKIVNGSVYIRKNNLGLNKINLIADEMPILADGKINNIFTDQKFDLYFNLKPKQDFVDKYFNNNRIYPLKIRGDIVYWLKLNGTKEDFNIQSEANLAKDSAIYYLGATVGDIENGIVLNLDANLLKQKFLKVKEFSYDKLITSQSKRTTRLNMLKVNGGIDLVSEDFVFHDLKVKTGYPTDARIFNIMFRKPNIKQGQFTSDLKFNGKLSNPKINGVFKIVETNIPFLDTTIKTISIVFKEKAIELVSVGEVLGNEVKFKGLLRNKLVPPYYVESGELQTKVLDLNYITEKLKSAHVNENNALDTFGYFDIKNTVIKSLKLSADEIKLRNLTANNVNAVARMNEKSNFSLNDFKFTISDGVLNGDFEYNLANNNIKLDMKAKNINANDLSIALFDLKNQIYGALTGNLKLSCNGSDFNRCMETLNGSAEFNVTDGRMPKLGSLEYLLKAGNLVKGGFTGLSINGVIDILTPLKTGDFSEIYGKMAISEGVAEDIEISTKGKDLSLFITGNYNFSNSQADMEVLGLLSKKISTMFGPLGNVSLNTLFNVIPGVDLSKNSRVLDNINKIPGIELSGKAFRKFIAEINGDINSDNYVSSFKWIN